MNNVTQAARAFCRARRTYHTQFRDYFQCQVQTLNTDRFWQLQSVFAYEVYNSRFGYDRTNGVEQAAGEFFRKPSAGHFAAYGRRDVPVYTLDEAVRFARTWRHITNQLYQPLFDVVSDRGDDAYGDLLDSLPLAGRDIVGRALRAGGRNSTGLSGNAQLEQAVTQACIEQDRCEFAELILHGENYISMHLAEAAQKYFAL